MSWLFAATLAVLLSLIACAVAMPPRPGNATADWWIGVILVVAVGAMLLIAAPGGV